MVRDMTDNRIGRHRPACRRWIAALPLCTLATGCVSPPRGPLSADAQRDFRRDAVRFLQAATQSDDPVVRMQGIEALQEAAPREGLPFIAENIDNGYAGVSFAAIMALGTLRDASFVEEIRTRAEDPDPNVRIAALFALHRLGERQRTGELADLLLKHRDARVRANAAVAIGRLGESQSGRVLDVALRREKKDAVKLQILEALALLGDTGAIERLLFYGYSAAPDQAALSLMLLGNARAHDAEELFRYRVERGDQPEIRLQAARALGVLGYDSGFDLALAHLFFSDVDLGRDNDPPQQQIARVRALAALALEAIGNRESLMALRRAFDDENQSDRVRVAVARAAIRIIDPRASTGAVRLADAPVEDGLERD
jgi:HEAT repeat protein